MHALLHTDGVVKDRVNYMEIEKIGTYKTLRNRILCRKKIWK